MTVRGAGTGVTAAFCGREGETRGPGSAFGGVLDPLLPPDAVTTCSILPLPSDGVVTRTIPLP
ncbi:hypothetical protein GCM10010317_064440 [Streptomyces mirabilis]|nr:hypothetical protein GCM10010317_064440 [Streptomyces mirabilis]